MDTHPTLFSVVARVLGIEESRVSEQTSPLNTTEWDSFNGMVLIAELEKAYHVEFSVEDVAAMQDVGNIARILQSKGVQLP